MEENRPQRLANVFEYEDGSIGDAEEPEVQRPTETPNVSARGGSSMDINKLDVHRPNSLFGNKGELR